MGPPRPPEFSARLIYVNDALLGLLNVIRLFDDRTNLSSDVVYPPVVSSNGGLEPGLNVGPSTLVLMLFLHKGQFSVRVLLALFLDDVVGER